jgi:predicted dehydrogenase
LATEPDRSVGIAVVGLGVMGRIHAHEVAASPRCTLAAVFDADSAAAERVSRELSAPAAPAIEGLLARDDVDAVILATPPSTHAGLVRLAAAAGKHVLCEKPLAATAAEGAQAVEAARRAGVELRVGFHRRFDPEFAAVRAKLAGGELGEPQLFSCSMRDPEPPADAGVRSGEERLVRDALCHDLDCARWLLGDVESVAAVGRAEAGTVFEAVGEPDAAVVMLRFASGAIGAMDATLRAGYFESRIEVVGSAGTVRVDGNQADRSFVDRYRGAYGVELAAFVDAVQGRGAGGADGDDALTTLRLCEAIDESMRAGGRDVAVGRGQLVGDKRG